MLFFRFYKFTKTIKRLTLSPWRLQDQGLSLLDRILANKQMFLCIHPWSLSSGNKFRTALCARNRLVEMLWVQKSIILWEMCFWKTDHLWNHWKNLKYTFFYCMCIFTCFRDRCIDSKWTGASISKKSENARTRKKHAFSVFSMFSQKVLLPEVHFLQKDTFLYLGHFDKAVSCI